MRVRCAVPQHQFSSAFDKRLNIRVRGVVERMLLQEFLIRRSIKFQLIDSELGIVRKRKCQMRNSAARDDPSKNEVFTRLGDKDAGPREFGTRHGAPRRKQKAARVARSLVKFPCDLNLRWGQAVVLLA